MRRASIGTVLFVSIAALTISGAGRAARPTTETVITEHFTKSIELTETTPCVGTVTYDVRHVFHITYVDDVIQHITDTQNGDVTFLSAVDGQLYTGRVKGTFNLQSNRPGAAYSESGTYQLHVTAPDGTRLRFWHTFHGTFAAKAESPTVEVINPRCSVR